MKISIQNIKNEAERKEFILQSEARFEHQLDQLIDALKKANNLKIISLCGPSCAGKTTTANKIIKELGTYGYLVKTISIDDFYKDKDPYVAECQKQGKEVDFEAVDAIDLEYLSECFVRIFKGETALLPSFNFEKGKRDVYTPFKMEKNHIVLFEGIQAMYPEIRKMFEIAKSFYIFIDAARDYESVYGDFTGREIRLARRLVRDYYRRATGAEGTFKLWRQVTKNEDTSIYPYRHLADFTVDSVMDYEPMMLKPHLEKILSSVTEQEVCYEKATAFLARFENFPVLSENLLPEHSVYHEFL